MKKREGMANEIAAATGEWLRFIISLHTFAEAWGARHNLALGRFDCQ
jgi:hypothetical protein